jgi:hypothetical protein
MRRIGAGTGLFIQVVCRRTPKSHLNKLLWQKKKKKKKNTTLGMNSRERSFSQAWGKDAET